MIGRTQMPSGPRVRRPIPSARGSEARALATPPRRFPTRDTGSVTAFSVLLLVAMMALLGLVVDGGMAMAANQAARDEAEQAARAGAGALSVDGLRNGQIVIDQQAAIAAAVAYTIQAGHPGSASASNGQVTVTIRYSMPTNILGIVGIDSLPVSATASAVDVHGVSRED